MEITVIHGQAHKGSGYHIAEDMRQKLAEDQAICSEFTLPTDADRFCVGCYNCIMKGCEFCPHREKIQLIVAAMERSDVIIIDSPTYCLEMSGALKNFFDHLGYMWLPHRPNTTMFSKVGIVISTAAGGGAKGVTRSLARQLFWLGVPVVYKMNYKVNAARWEDVPDKIKGQICQSVANISGKVKSKAGKAKPHLKLKFMFHIMRGMQQSNSWNMTDKEHWSKQGWLGNNRPW